jgi:hypothetical protein
MSYMGYIGSRYGNGLNGPSRTKVEEMVRFTYPLEARRESRQ